MKITDLRKQSERRAVPLNQIPVGTVFSARMGSSPSVFLRTYSEVVDLNDPGSTWAASKDIAADDVQVLRAELTVNDDPTGNKRLKLVEGE